MPTITSYVNSTSNDVYVDRNGANYSSSGASLLAASSTDATSAKTVGLRFTALALANAATITAAKVFLAVPPGQKFASIADLDIYGEAIDDSTIFSSGNDPEDRARTTATVSWYTGTYNPGTQFGSPDFANIVQEIVNRAGWVSGNDLAIILRGRINQAAAKNLIVDSFDATSPEGCPYLQVSYALASGFETIFIDRTITRGDGVQDVSAAKPALALTGDLLLAFYIVTGNRTVVLPAGWTETENASGGTSSSDVRVSAAWHIVGAGEAGPYTFDLDGTNSGDQWVIILAYRNFDPATPIQIDGSSTGTSASISAPSVTTTKANTTVVSCAAVADDQEIDPNSTVNTRAYTLPMASAVPLTARVGDFLQVSAGATGAKTYTTPSDEWTGVTVAINPLLTQTLSPSGIASAEAFGNATIVRGSVTLSNVGGIASAEAMGAATVVRGAVTVVPVAIASAEAFGNLFVTQAFVIQPGGIASAEVFGNPTVVVGPVTIQPGGIASAEAFGAPTIQTLITLLPVAIASAEAFGNTTVLPGPMTLQPVSIATAEAFGNPTVIPGSVTVQPIGIASAEAFGNPTLHTTITLIAQGIPSAEAFGLVTVEAGPVYLAVTGIASAEAFGIPFVVPPGTPWIFAELSDQSLLLVELPEIDLVKNAGWVEVLGADEHIEIIEEN